VQDGGGCKSHFCLLGRDSGGMCDEIMLYALLPTDACLRGADWGSIREILLGLGARAWKDGPYCSVCIMQG